MSWAEDFFDDHFAELFLKNHSNTQADIEFIKSVGRIKESACVFDQGCGIGRLSHEISKLGATVIGVDIVKDYIQRAQESCPKGIFKCANAETFISDQKCDLALNWWTSFGYGKIRKDDLRVLECAYQSLKPGGYYLLEIPNAEYCRRQYAHDHPLIHESRIDDVKIKWAGWLSENQEKIFKRWSFEKPDGETGTKTGGGIRLYTVDEIENMLTECGFKVLHCYGGVDHSKFDKDSQRCIVIAQKPEKKFFQTDMPETASRFRQSIHSGERHMISSFWTKFIKICDSYPDHIAIADRGKNVTYQDLKNAAANFGENLKSQNIGPEDIIALSLEKSADYIIALLGCWYAGAAFAPVPLSLPLDRRKFILDDLGPKKIIEHLPRDLLQTQESSPYKTTENTLAYVIYTSGSTGVPKGVMIEHRGIVNFIHEQIRAFDMNEKTVSFFHLSINFDASMSDIGCALLSGACLIIEDDQTVKDPTLFLKALSEHKVTCIDMPPSLMNVFRPEDMPPSLKTIVIGGEASNPKTIRHWAKSFNLVNVYGPTEATVCTSLNICDPNTWDRPVIGKPLKNVGYHILDEEMKNTAEGELYISGLQLARGYLNRPNLNAKKFITRNETRLYKTGDRVRKHTSGEIEFLGRIDRQFKLRGQLIEPDEIEQTLKTMDEISNAAVIKIENKLIAYITANHDVDTEAVKKNLAKKLSLWMIPDHIIKCKGFPKTPSGKTDYAALADTMFLKDVSSHLPTTSTEKNIYTLWESVLGHKNFGIDESYFDVGGDSLNIMRLSIAAEACGMTLPVASIIKYKTIQKLAEYLDGVSTQENGTQSADWLRNYVKTRYLNRLPSRAGKPPPRPYRNIFVTGAGGFLGGQVLQELLQNTSAKLYCLTRNSPLKVSSDRIVGIKGDLEKPNLGLDNATYKNLSESCDAVYHNAARVNTVLDFDTLAPSNLEGCFEVLKFANTVRQKDIHYASTLSVFVSTDQNSGTVYEHDNLDMTEKIYGGYAQTKWAADWMYNNIPDEFCRIWNYRFGLITGSSQTGNSPKGEFLTLFFEGVKSLGVLPRLCDQGMKGLKIDITPVDYAAKAMVGISLNCDPQIYHIANKEGYSYEKLIKTMKEEGIEFELISLEEWLNLPEQKHFTDTEAAAYLALCRALPEDEFNAHRTSDLFQATDITFDQENVSKAGFHPPQDLDNLMRLYIRRHSGNNNSEDKKSYG